MNWNLPLSAPPNAGVRSRRHRPGFGPRTHFFPKLYREGGETFHRHAQSSPPFGGERQSPPGLTLRSHTSGREGGEPPHEAAAVAAIIRPHENEGTGVGRGPRVKDRRLQVFDSQRGGRIRRYGPPPFGFLVSVRRLGLPADERGDLCESLCRRGGLGGARYGR